MLVFDDVYFGYGERNVIGGLSFRLEDGGLLCFKGASGIGKSTILQLAAGLLAPRQGHVTSSHRKVGYVFQDERLLPWRNVRDNVVYVLKGKVGEPVGEAERMLSLLGLGEVLDKLPKELSGGMQRRVNMARALAIKPDLLILDEAFSFLDEATAGICRDALTTWREERGGSVLAVSHDVPPLEGMRELVLRESPIRGMLGEEYEIRG